LTASENSAPDSHQKFEARLEPKPSGEDSQEINPWTPGFLARIPQLGFLAMIFNITNTYSSSEITPADINQ
jgi:hypothetical protein